MKTKAKISKSHSKINHESRKVYFTVALGLVVAISFCVAVVLNERRTSAPALVTSHVTESDGNIVINTVGAPVSLVNTIASEKAGCRGVTDAEINTTYIIRATDSFAKVRFGCMLDANMYYKKVGSQWRSISPTNNFIDGTPLCGMVKEHSIPVEIDKYCYDMTFDDQGGATPSELPTPILNPNA